MLSSPQRIAILTHPLHEPAAAWIADMAAEAGLSVVFTSTLDAPSAAAALPASGAVAALVLGGDGTMLRAAQWLGGCDLPLMGFNFGTLGYLTCAADAAGFQAALAELASNTHREEKRVMLSSHLSLSSRLSPLPDALNDVVLTRHTGRLVWLDCLLDGEHVATYACDGLIVATPTGSTAYALSAGGPIVLPQTPALVVCPIGPHTLSSRPLVVQDTARVTLRVARAHGPLVVSVDGNDTPVPEGAEVVVAKRERPLRILFRSTHTPAKTFREKLGWSHAPVTQGAHTP
ncbi:MAG: NAD(+)/NADH kinase [Kiritimatiellaeota bacterium]|nr:NAD(+)/NADH kinase [Kiritimatiellota bacterium]